MRHRITLIPGDGSGPDVSLAAKRCVEATGVEIDWDVCEAGEEVMEKYGSPLPQNVLDSIKKNGVALKGPITTPIGTGIRSVNVLLRKTLDLYACVRPCKSYEGTRTKYKDIDLVVIRENTEDLYAGIEFYEGESDTRNIIKAITRLSKAKINSDSSIGIKLISRQATQRIVKFAFEYALKNGRRKVTAVHKANIMKYTDGLFLDVAREVALEYADRIEFEDKLIDNMCMQLIQKPQLYDVMVLPNLYGDIISDLCAGLIGGLGVAPGANIGEGVAVFEATHGSAPKYKGMNKINPTAMILSAVMMLRYIKEENAADRLEAAVSNVIREAKFVTYDLKEDPNDTSCVGTSEMADAIIERLKE